ncbi:MAG: aspartate carbamoyltransferase [Candidatus Saccharimonadia bacterium]
MLADKYHVISTKQFFDHSILESLFALTNQVKSGKFVSRSEGKILATLFYEPSTRTRFSFESAMMRLGGNVISTEAAGHFSSVSKGESLEDTIRVVSSYCDVIVLRHPEAGSAERAATVATVPLINAGDGLGEHPTQALLDVYTISQYFPQVNNLKIALVGDLLNGRTIHSLLYLLGLYKNISFELVAPSKLQLPKQYKNYLASHNLKFRELNSLDGLSRDIDVLYVTRVQKERFADTAEYETLKHYFIVDSKLANSLQKSAIIMHPLPRVGELLPEVDTNPRAKYFEQAANGLFVRMALLDHLLSS